MMLRRRVVPRSVRRDGVMKMVVMACAASSGDATNLVGLAGRADSEMKSLVVMSKEVVLSSPMPMP